MKKPLVHFRKEGMVCSRCMMKGTNADLHTNCTRPFNIKTPLCADCPLRGLLLKNTASAMLFIKESFEQMIKDTQEGIDELNQAFNEFMKEYEN